MKKNLLLGALVHLICTQVHALQTDTSAVPTRIEMNTLEEQAALQAESTKQASHLSERQAADSINCDYKISVETKKIDLTFILNWAEYAATQSFHFNPESIEDQLQKLQSCYTDKGWEELKTAMLRSGNLEVIKAQNLKVTSQVDGPVQLIESKSDQWKIALPLQVIYYNDDERVTHFLNLYLTIGRKIRGELGIMQMIATPRTAPSFQKAGSVKETAQSIYLIIAQKNANTLDTVKKQLLNPLSSTLFSLRTVRTPSSSDDFISGALQQRTTLSRLAKAPPPVPAFNWVNFAIAHSFDFKPKFLKTMQQLQSWYVEKRVASLSATIQKSGSIAANTAQTLALSTSREELPTDKNQWKITLPLHVAYANDKGKIGQLLNINLTVDWKITGDPGMMPQSMSSRTDPVSSQAVQTSPSQPVITSADVNERINATQQVLPNTMALAQSTAMQPSPVEKNTQATTSIVLNQQKPIDNIDCDYRIPVETTTIDSTLVLKWAEQAATQSFHFDAKDIDNQLQKLQSCYTESGWIEFKSALDKSGNIEAIKSLKLTMNSQMDGQAQLVEFKDNYWKITLPLKVIWQNDKDKVTQALNINLTVGRKITGDLGIIQIVATLGAASAASDQAQIKNQKLAFNSKRDFISGIISSS